MFDYLLDETQGRILNETRNFVNWVPREMVLDMDADRIKFPKAFLKEAGRRNLLGCRYPKKWGGRHMDWVTTCAILEEIGTLGYEFACVFGVGAELVIKQPSFCKLSRRSVSPPCSDRFSRFPNPR